MIHFFYLYLSILITCALIGVLRYRDMDNALKVAFFFIALTALNESLAYLIERKGGNNLPLYHVYTILALVLVSVYYFRLVGYRRHKLYTNIALVFWPLVGMINMHWQPIRTINSNMMVIESTCLIIMSLHSLYLILLDDTILNIAGYPHFWIWAGFLLIWCSTFFFWAVFDDLLKYYLPYIELIFSLRICINIIGYGAVGASFLLASEYKKNGR